MNKKNKIKKKKKRRDLVATLDVFHGDELLGVLMTQKPGDAEIARP